MFPVDVYIVGHHGSETSSSKALLDIIKPTYAIISSEGATGQYKNPDQSVMKRLDDVKAQIYATYRSGDIKVVFDKNGVSLFAKNKKQVTLQDY